MFESSFCPVFKKCILLPFSYSILSLPLFYFSPLFLFSSFYFFPLLFFPLLSPPFYSCPLFGHPQKPINLQAELRAFFLFITRSGHVCLSLWPWPLCVHFCTRLWGYPFVYMCLLPSQVNTRPNPANDCAHTVPDSTTNNRWACWSTRSGFD